MIVTLLTNIEPVPKIRQVAFDIMSTFIDHVNQIEYFGENSEANLIINSRLFTLFALIVVFSGLVNN